MNIVIVTKEGKEKKSGKMKTKESRMPSISTVFETILEELKISWSKAIEKEETGVREETEEIIQK